MFQVATTTDAIVTDVQSVGSKITSTLDKDEQKKTAIILDQTA